MKDNNIPHEPCVMKPSTTTVFSFPIASPPSSVRRTNLTAIQHLRLWLLYQRHWCEHKPSITISVKDSEWLAVGDFVYQHFDEISGVSFLPYSDHTYQQAPYQEVEYAEYADMLEKMPTTIDWTKLSDYEKEDNTVGSQSYACSGDSCEIVDLT